MTNRSSTKTMSLHLAVAAAAGAAALYTLQQILAASRRPGAEHRDGEDGQAAAAADGGSSGTPSPLRQPPPHPNWQPPQKLPPPFATEAMHTVDPAQTPSDVLYPLVISAVVPRPIGGWGRLAARCECNLLQPSHTLISMACCSWPLPLQPLCQPRAAPAWATWLPTHTSMSWPTAHPTSQSASAPAACAATAGRTAWSTSWTRGGWVRLRLRLGWAAAPTCRRRALPACLPAPHFLCSEFVVNIMSEWFVEAANHCCGNFDYEENEMQLSGLTPLPSLKVWR